MPELSPRTIGLARDVLREMEPSDTYLAVERKRFWKDALFDFGFAPLFIDVAAQYGFDWSEIMLAVYRGHFGPSSDAPLPRWMLESALKRLVVLAYSELRDKGHKEEIRRSLALDGFEISLPSNEVVRIEGPISVSEEQSRIIELLWASSLRRKELIEKHLNDAAGFFQKGETRPTINEARSAFEAIVEDLVEMVEKKNDTRAAANFKGRIEYLEKTGIISDEERAALGSGYGFLSAGSHPGVAEEWARIGAIFGLELSYLLLLKATRMV